MRKVPCYLAEGSIVVQKAVCVCEDGIFVLRVWTPEICVLCVLRKESEIGFRHWGHLLQRYEAGTEESQNRCVALGSATLHGGTEESHLEIVQ